MDELEKYTLEGLAESLPKVLMILQEKGETEQGLESGKFRIDLKYQATTSAIDGREGIDLLYEAKGQSGESISEMVSLYTGFLDYNVKGAVNEFTRLDLPLIKYLFDPDTFDQQEINIVESVLYNPFVKPEKVLGWKILIGTAKETIDGSSSFIDPAESREIFQVLYAAINKFLLPRPQTYLIKNWVTRKGMEGLWADCRVNMQNWKDGVDHLYHLAESWSIGVETKSLKQNILLIPCKMEELEKGEEILEKVKENARQALRAQKEPEKKKKGWQFWK
ncbi:MAG: hypothetical protein H6581_12565 [Bacteroidia bacterium]|nr:hypothetical protein [Bacteroidia bacterium]